MKTNNIKKLAVTAMLFAVGLVLPFLTGQIPAVGRMLLPMHLPVMLCGLVCGPAYGLILGLLLPITRSLIFSMPVLFPTAIAMCFELAAYGFVLGMMFKKAKWKCIRSLYRCLIISMLAGRIVLALADVILLSFTENGFVFSAFLTSAFLEALPGIACQLILIPAIMLALGKTHLIEFKGFQNNKVKSQEA